MGKPAKQASLLLQLRDTLVAIALMLVTPPSTIIFWYTASHDNGNFAAMGERLWNKGFIGTMQEITPLPDATTWTIILSYITFEASLMIFMPGKQFKGPVTPKGNVPIYKANGLQSYFATLLALGALYYFKVITATLIYNQLGKIYAALTVGAFVFCLLLYVKGHLFPSSSDSGSVGNPIMDFYWGMELYPRIFNFDLKMFVNCRFGMMSWPILIIIYALKQYEDLGYISDAMIISVAVQLVYLTKFYHWETGYLWTIDIMHDRFGYYICWGCTAWVPSFYTSPAFYWLHNPTNFFHEFGYGPTVAMALLGAYFVYTNWSIDQERITFRESKGEALIWGKPAQKIITEYHTEDGKLHKGMLLTSGWWGVSRHINYVFELLATLMWAVPIQFSHIFPYSYFFFLVALLVHRLFRDEMRMQHKYGKYYVDYCKRVPYRMIPYIF